MKQNLIIFICFIIFSVIPLFIFVDELMFFVPKYMLLLIVFALYSSNVAVNVGIWICNKLGWGKCFEEKGKLFS